MTKLIRLISSVLLLLLFTATSASPTNPTDGIEYQTLGTPQPTVSGKKVEVIEFFGYFCNHCHALERPLSKWVKKQGSKIAFKRIPVTPREARVYFSLEAMGQVEQLHEKLFHAVQKERLRMNNEPAVLDFFVRNGVNKEMFTQHYHSFAVQQKVQALQKMNQDYKVEDVPMLVINGEYVTSPAIVSKSPSIDFSEASLHDATFKVMDWLVEHTRKKQRK